MFIFTYLLNESWVKIQFNLTITVSLLLKMGGLNLAIVFFGVGEGGSGEVKQFMLKKGVKIYNIYCLN